MSKHDDSPYWVNVTLEDEETEERVRLAIEACRAVHEWAMIEIRSLWTDSDNRRIGYNELVHRMTNQLWKMGIKNQAQRFSLVTALSRAVGRFNQEMIVHTVGLTESEARVIFPSPRMPQVYRVLDVQSRSVWKQYMTQYNYLSTHYGAVYLGEGDRDEPYEWRSKLSIQAAKEGIKAETIHYLIYSATLRERDGKWQAHFNFHKKESKNGKKRLARA